MKQGPHILFILEFYYPHVGGVETLFHTLIKALTRAGYRCTVLTQRFDQSLPARETRDGVVIRRIRVPNRYLFSVFGFFAALPLVRRADLIHTTSYNAGLPAFFSGFLARKATIITFHEAWGKLWFQLPFIGSVSAWGHYLFEQVLLRLPFRQFIAVSGATAQRLREEGVGSQRITMIPNGLEYAEWTQGARPGPTQPPLPPGREEAFTYTYFGRIGISKGLDLLLPAAAAFARHYPRSCLQLIIPRTPSPITRWVEDFIEAHQLHQQISIRHSLPFSELKHSLQRSRWVVVPSYSEGFCFAAAEAAALGVPLVHSNRAALAEVVSGYHAPMHTFSIEGLTDALLRAARNEWMFKPYQPYPMANSLQAYCRLYEEVLPAFAKNSTA